METYISKSEEDTKQFAKNLAKDLKTGDILVLTGELGSGKTKFTEGILSYFGLEDEISSPTFTIVNEYDAKDFKIFHFDLYRLADVDEFYAMGGEEYLQNGLCIFEWGEMIEEILQTRYTKITFSRNTENTDFRNLRIEEIDK